VKFKKEILNGGNVKKCCLCKDRPASVPDRYRWSGGRFIKQICTECHAARLRSDLIKVVEEHNNNDDKENKALDALIVASLRASELKNNISGKDIEDLTNAGLNLTKEEEENIEDLGDDFFSISKRIQLYE